MALTWNLSRLSTKVGLASDEDGGMVTPSPYQKREGREATHALDAEAMARQRVR
jgi:hypothetical protein